MPILGAHMSIAGGYHRGVEAAAAYGMQTCQNFTNLFAHRNVSGQRAASIQKGRCIMDTNDFNDQPFFSSR